MESNALTSLLQKDEWQGVITDFSANSDTLLIVFGGIKGQLDIPVFEFSKIAAEFCIKKIFIRDHEQAWYHRGVRGVAEDIDELTRYLRRQIEHQGCRRVVMLGNSMGAYAAILTGCLLTADEVIAFSPQTFIGRFRRWLAWDHRWWPQMLRMHWSRSAIPAYYDLRSALRSRPGPTAYHIYYAKGDKADRRHAVHMKGLPRVILHPIEAAGHRVVRLLRDSGALTEVLDRALGTQHER